MIVLDIRPLGHEPSLQCQKTYGKWRELKVPRSRNTEQNLGYLWERLSSGIVCKGLEEELII